MQTCSISNSGLITSCIGYGCMTLGGRRRSELLLEKEKKHALSIIEYVLDRGITLFDHADIYCSGKSEYVFSQIWDKRSSIRQKIVLQSKCGIRLSQTGHVHIPKRYDSSYQHIINSVEAILKRLKTDYLDILLLHRPDPLMIPSEVAKAFNELLKSGKVRHFGVSNHSAYQMALLQKWLDVPLVVNQLELNLLHYHLIHNGIVFNQKQNTTYPSDGTLEYCQMNNIHVQAWSPLASGNLWKKTTEKSNKLTKLSVYVDKLAKHKACDPSAILLAWLLRLPMNIQPIIGSVNKSRIKASCQASTIELSAEEWYSLLTLSRGDDIP